MYIFIHTKYIYNMYIFLCTTIILPIAPRSGTGTIAQVHVTTLAVMVLPICKTGQKVEGILVDVFNCD